MSFRSFLRLSLLILACVCGTAAAQSRESTAGQFSRLPKRGLEASDLTTTRGADIPIRSTMFETPPDLDDMIRGSVPYDYEYQAIASAEAFAFEEIKTITVQRLEREWIESEAEDVEVLDLGPTGRTLPPPPDWQRTFGNQPAWTGARGIKPGALVPWVNRAQACWGAQDSADAPREILMRQKFDLLSAHEIMTATLRVAGRAEIVAASLNEHPLHLAGDAQIGHGEFEVSTLIQSGANILALWVRPQTGSGIKVEPPAIAWHIELQRVRGRDEKQRNQWPQALLVTLEGDRVWGGVASTGVNGLVLETEYGAYEAEWEQVEAVLFPRGWIEIEDPKRRGMARKIASWWNERGRPLLTEPAGVGLPLRLAPRPLGGQVLLSEGRAMAARPVAMDGGALDLLDPRGAKTTARPDEVFGIYPASAAAPPMQKPKPELAPLYCRVTTWRGERISGLLRQMNRSGLVVEAPGGDFLKMSARAVVAVSFPFHGLLAGKPAPAPPDGTDNPQIGILGRVQGGDEDDGGFAAVNARFQYAAFLAGLPCAVVPQPMMTDSFRLSPEYFPVLACLDPVGEYPDSLNAEGDARTVLRQYVEKGGTLLLYSRGGALRTAVRISPDGMTRVPAPDGLVRDLGLRIALPGDPVPTGINPFDRPPSQTLPLVFARGGDLARELTELPPVFEMGGQMLSPYYPMLGAEAGGGGTAGTIYELRMQEGVTFGPAVQIVPVGSGRVLIMDHLAWNSCVDGQPFETVVLPALLKWAFGKR